MLLPFLVQIVGQQMRNPMQMERFEAKGFMQILQILQILQHCRRSNKQQATSNKQQAISQILNELIQTEICLRSPKFCHQDHTEEVFRCEFHHAGLDGRAISL
jgi:hypothetical protein